MRHVPWVTLIAAAVFFVTPFGWDSIDKSFNAGEQLARSLAQVVLFGALGVVAALAILEIAIRFYIYRRVIRRADGG